VILVSHDRHLIEACADRSCWWRTVRSSLRRRSRRLSASGAGANAGAIGPNAGARTRARPAAARARGSPPRGGGRASGARPLRRRIADAEAAVARLNAEIARIDAILAGLGSFSHAIRREPRTLAKAARGSCERARPGGGGLAGSERARGSATRES
jgi:ATP-binding cassette subfamily F protein 3